MIQYYLKTARRNLAKSPFYTGLNLFGLALGLAAAFLITAYAYREWRTDHHFAEAEKIHRIGIDFFSAGGFAPGPEVLLPYLREQSKDVAAATQFKKAYQPVPVVVDEVAEFQEPNVYYIDSSFFDVFSYTFSEGSPLLSKESVIISRTLAKKYFGDRPAIGQVLMIDKEKTPYQVSGVVDLPRAKSHLTADIWLLAERGGRPNWTSASWYTYVRLKQHGHLDGLQSFLEQLRRQTIYPTFRTSVPYEEWVDGSQSMRFIVQPLTDIYLRSDLKFELSAGGNAGLVYVLFSVALFLLLIAVINYINLTTARASVRAKEIGVKKTMGGSKGELVKQFLTEAVFFSLLAAVLAGGLVEVLAWVLRKITEDSHNFSVFADWRPPLLLSGLALIVGLLAGVYPAFYLTRFRPARVFQGSFSLPSNRLFRSSLVVFQFTLACVLIAGSLLIYRQLRYMQTMDKGFKQEGVLVIDNLNALGDKQEVFRQTLAAQPQVQSLSLNSRMPAGKSVWIYTFQTPQMEESITLQSFPVDEHYLPTMQLQLLQGRNFSADMATDTNALILNESAVKALGLGDNPLGAEVNEVQRVIGVVRDFNFLSPREAIEPVVLFLAPNGYEMAVRLKNDNVSQFLATVQQTWQTLSPEEPLKYSFLDENFAQLAEKERIFSQIISFFTLLSLLIACLGLFGLVAFVVEQKTKEIGIRKVLGATAANIVGLLSTDFIKLVGIAFCLAAPLSWYAGRRWLEQFAHRVDMEWWIFAAAGLAAIAVAFLTVSAQALRAAWANPVKSLRSE